MAKSACIQQCKMYKILNHKIRNKLIKCQKLPQKTMLNRRLCLLTSHKTSLQIQTSRLGSLTSNNNNRFPNNLISFTILKVRLDSTFKSILLNILNFNKITKPTFPLNSLCYIRTNSMLITPPNIKVLFNIIKPFNQLSHLNMPKLQVPALKRKDILTCSSCCLISSSSLVPYFFAQFLSITIP